MKSQPVVPAVWERNADGLPWSAAYADLYHPASGAIRQADHVFLAGSGLPERWRGRERFVVLETGFGLGNNFLATWRAWRDDARACERLHFVSIERHPLRRDDLRDAHRASPTPELAAALIDAWPPLAPGLHHLDFDGGRVQLLLAFGDVSTWLPELIAPVDAFYLDGFAPARNPDMWQPRVYKAMARMATPGATVATWTAARAVREGLAAAGFQPRLAQGQGGKRDITLARYDPAFTPRRPIPRFVRPSGDRHAIVVGAGLAGCATAWALAQQGWRSTVVDRRAAPALETSGNPAGLFHGTVHPQDGPHARFSRAAALQIERVARTAIADHGVPGQVDGLLRLTDGESPAAMRSLLADQRLPAEFVQALDAADASAVCGLAIDGPAWFYPGGGWISPVRLCRWFLDRAGSQATFRGGVDVASLQAIDAGWRLLDADGRTIDEAGTVVLANADGATRLLRGLHDIDWPVESVRGQISMAPGALARPLPRIPVAGSGYLLPAIDGEAVFGATSQRGDTDGSVRLDDHRRNLATLARIRASEGISPLTPEQLRGRVGWRLVASDRLPLVGGVPDRDAAFAVECSIRLPNRLQDESRTRLPDQPRLVPRHRGLFMCTALGSRGIASSALLARVVASAITGAPCPVESSLLDAIDAARFMAREARASGGRSIRGLDVGRRAALGGTTGC